MYICMYAHTYICTCNYVHAKYKIFNKFQQYFLIYNYIFYEDVKFNCGLVEAAGGNKWAAMGKGIMLQSRESWPGMERNDDALITGKLCANFILKIHT